MESIVFNVCVIGLFLYSVVLHEVAHGYAAYRAGDPTAYMLGRLSLNPLRHIDPFLTVIVPLVLYFTAGFIFGGAKPVPVNPRNYRRPVRDDIVVSLAGVAVNLALVVFFALIANAVYYLDYRAGMPHEEIIASLAFRVPVQAMFLNMLLFVFNLIPIPPLDGSHVFKYLLPPDMRAAYARMGFFGIFLLLIFINTPLFSAIMNGAMDLLLKVAFLPVETLLG